MNVVIWGILVSCTAAVSNYSGILAIRILLGLVVAVIGLSSSFFFFFFFFFDFVLTDLTDLTM